MVLLFTCGMKAHTPVMYTGSEQSWNGGRILMTSFSVWQKQDQATKDFLLMDFMSEDQQFTKHILLLNKYIVQKRQLQCMHVNLGLCEQRKMYWPHKENQIAYSKSNSLLFLRIFKCCCKSEAQKTVILCLQRLQGSTRRKKKYHFSKSITSTAKL